MSGWINLNSGKNWTNQNFLVKFTEIVIEITGINIIRIFWFVHFHKFFSV